MRTRPEVAASLTFCTRRVLGLRDARRLGAVLAFAYEVSFHDELLDAFDDFTAEMAAIQESVDRELLRGHIETINLAMRRAVLRHCVAAVGGLLALPEVQLELVERRLPWASYAWLADVGSLLRDAGARFDRVALGDEAEVVFASAAPPPVAEALP